MADNKLSEMISNALDSIRTIADSSTVIGDPISTGNGTVIIPVSKVALGFASGGLDYVPKSEKEAATKLPKPNHETCFGGGGGTGVSVTPVCFLVVKPDGNVTLLNVNNPTAMPLKGAASTINSVSNFIEKTPDIISRFMALFAKKDPVTDLDDEKLKKDIEDLKTELKEEAAKDAANEASAEETK
jgi:sporulation protein YtfJ